ncbi:hypothetical protein SAFG77S_00174 [Streptomyces afghaniensis]
MKQAPDSPSLRRAPTDSTVFPAGQVGVGGGPEGGGAAVVAGGGDQQGALLAQFPHEVLHAEQAVGAAVGGAGGEAEDVGPAAGVDGLEELLAELRLQDGARVVEAAAHGDVGAGRDGGDEPGDERAVTDVLLEDSLLVALLDLGVAVGVGEERAGAVVVCEAGVDDAGTPTARSGSYAVSAAAGLGGSLTGTGTGSSPGQALTAMCTTWLRATIRCPARASRSCTARSACGRPGRFPGCPRRGRRPGSG